MGWVAVCLGSSTARAERKYRISKLYPVETDESTYSGYN